MVSRFHCHTEDNCTIYLDLGLQTYPVITPQPFGWLAESSSCLGYSCSEFVIKCVSVGYSATKVVERFSDWKLDIVDWIVATRGR